MSDKLTGICVIGTGRAGLIHARNFARTVPGARLAALVDPQEQALAEAGRELGVRRLYPDYRQALADPEVQAVVVVTPTKFHRDIVVSAARAGKHILCEKPMAMTVEECQEMNRVAEEHGMVLQVGFMRRFDAGFQAAREAIERGDIGAVVQVKSLTHGPSVPQPWMYDLKASNGPLAEVNSHDIDTLRWYTGSDFQEVYAVAGNYRCPEARERFPDFYDNVSMVVRFRNGMQGFIGGAVAVAYGYDSRVEVLGAKGMLFVGRQEHNATMTCTAEGWMTRPFVKSWRNLFMEAYAEEDREFVRAVAEGRPPKVSGRDGMMAVQVVEAGNRSIREGRPVSLPEI
jgi:myo-inositol 2-dehydrogenase/D-chiro-inositol 1-dehydrogenase/scyllo-inositol 2-dehydrogenase (NAD+)